MDKTDHTSDKRALADALACLADATRVHVARVLTSGPELVLRGRAAECYRIPAAIVLPIHAGLRDGWMTCPRDQRPALGRVIQRVLDSNAWGSALRQALGRVVALAHAGCLDLAAQLLRCKEDAEDVVSEFELRLPRLAIWFDPAAADPWPWLRTAVRWQCHDAWRHRAREATAPRSISTPVTFDADDPAEETDPPGPSFDEVLRAAVTGARQKARASLLRDVAMWRDHEIARDHGSVNLGALARDYFGKDTKQNRNRVSQRCKRVRVRLEHAARQLRDREPTSRNRRGARRYPRRQRSRSRNAETTTLVVDRLINFLLDLGVTHAFGVSGGSIAPLWARLLTSPIRALHFRHETGAVFSAAQYYFMTGTPTAVFVTTGPGFTNALSGLFSARWDGAKVIVISGGTDPGYRGRWAFQEMGPHVIPQDLMTSGPLFHFAQSVDGISELAEVQRRIASGIASRNAFLAHLSIAPSLQCALLQRPGVLPTDRVANTNAVSVAHPTASEMVVDACASMLQEGPFAIWVGFGARSAAREVRELATRTSSAVMCSPRAKGIFPEDHPQFVGVTGIFGGHGSVSEYMAQHKPLRILVLGTRLGESTSAWSNDLVPARGFIQVDIEPASIGVGYPEVKTFGVQSDIGTFVTRLLARFPETVPTAKDYPRPKLPRLPPRHIGGGQLRSHLVAVSGSVRAS